MESRLDDGSESEITCKQCVVEELKPENVAPCHENTRLFVDSQWSAGGQISTIYFVYRLAAAAVLVIWVVCDFLDEAGRWYSFDYGLWFIFATNWSMVALVVTAVMMAISTTYYYIRTRCQKRELPRPISLWLSIQWIIYNIGYNSAIVVSLAYWSFVLLTDLAMAQDFLLTPMSQMKHSLNTVYVIIDLFSNAIPVRVYHLVYPLLVGVVYAIFNAAYFLNDNRGPDGLPFAYAAMDWRHPLGSTITCVLGFILSCIVHLMLFGLYRLRRLAHRRLQVAVAADVDGYRPMVGHGDATVGRTLPAILTDDERGPIFPNGFDSGSVGGVSYHVNAGYQSTGDTVEHVVNGK